LKTAVHSALCAVALISSVSLTAQNAQITAPRILEAGSAFSIGTTGSGTATLYIAGPGQLLRRDVRLGETASFPAGALYNAGRYVVFLSGPAAGTAQFDVVAAREAKNLSFLARPSRLPVGLHDGITGAVYAFDAYQNLILAPQPVWFELSTPSGALQRHAATTRYGAAWTSFDSSASQGTDRFVARTGNVLSTRVVDQVPGGPCILRMTARPAGSKIELDTDPVRDCSGNAIPDGTVVTFTETWSGNRSTVDVPLKRGVARVEMPAHSGATITVASGVALGNQIHWER
jgi:hypothetical protein